MGWTGCDDPLSQVELTFPSAEAAISYARRQGLKYTLQGQPDNGSGPVLVSDNPDVMNRAAGKQRRTQRQWVERTTETDLLRRERNQANNDRVAVYKDPKDVLGDPNLTPERKRGVLRRWALDAYQTEREHSKSKLRATPSLLHQVIDALLDLEEPRVTGASFHHIKRMAG
jgi:ETC complex I subunit-like protein